MANKPELHKTAEGRKSVTSVYDDNFDKIIGFVDDSNYNF